MTSIVVIWKACDTFTWGGVELEYIETCRDEDIVSTSHFINFIVLFRFLTDYRAPRLTYMYFLNMDVFSRPGGSAS